MARKKPQTDPGLFVEPPPEIEPGLTGDSQRDAMRREAVRVRQTRPEQAGFINQLLARLRKNDEPEPKAKKPKQTK